MSLEGGIRIRASFPLAVQILALVGGALVIAQLVAIGLTLLLPPPPPTVYSLKDIANALKGEKVSLPGARPLVRKVLVQPPSYRSQGWIVSPQARADLAELVGAAPDDVRLMFYFPRPVGPFQPPNGGYPQAPRVKPAAFSTFQGPDQEAAAHVVQVGFGPPGVPPGGAPGGGFGLPGPVGGGGFGGAAGGPRTGAAVPTRAWSEPSGVVAAPAVGGSSSDEPAVPEKAIPAWRQWAKRVWPEGHPPRVAGSVTDLTGKPVQPYSPFPGLAPLVARHGELAGASETSPSAEAGAKPDGGPGTVASEALKPDGKSARATAALDLSGLLAPAPLVAQKTGDSSGWVLGATPPGARSVRPTPFVPGDFVAALRIGPSQWATVQPLPEGFPNRWQRRVFLWFATAMLLIAPLAWLFARRLTGPLAAFAAAAESLGRDPAAALGALTGPAEVGRAARAFNEMQARLKRFVDDRTAMVGAISHDLRTPLARMRFRLERAPPELQKGMLSDIQQMEEMLNSVLTFIHDASEPAARKRIDLRSIIECAVEDCEMVGGDVVLRPGPPVSVEVDPSAVRRVATNLIDNAIKYGRRAEVSLITNGREATVAIADEGPGLGADELERVFAPFYRSDTARSMNQGGIGLGLAVSRSIARAHGGDVRLTSRPEGLLAELTLPLAPAAIAPTTPYLRPFFASASGASGEDATLSIDDS